MPEPAHHEHAYRRAIIIGLTLLGLIVLAGVVYQYGVNKKNAERELRAQYNNEQLQQAQAFFNSAAENPAKPMTDAELKAAAEFFKANPAQPINETELRAQFDAMNALQEQNYQEWKAARAQ